MKDDLIEKVSRHVENAMNSAIPEEWEVAKFAAERILTTILEAIKTPTEGMMKAAHVEEDRCAIQNYGGSPSADDIYTAMIEALIKELSDD